ncbi:flagellar basal body rod protein FlgG [Geomicrobium sp. JCM 19038]|uniref:flagellar basal body rod protein FlgG n=1 Tax=Geomicrobium sp. JCM 19038 TaxID=1460635 RepID=UPI00045F29B6|nr:flagellar basal body rod protein FlgG [Geomicrobium sp. JCM 19038]GAK07532.1 flagellar hook protein FlgE [Geomicrobium sp. JCM 19038]
MIRSMYSGITGLQNHQQKLDVIGNNIANVNTYGFKKGRYTFEDMLSQQVQGASAGTGDLGGTNPRQIGLGSSTGSITNIHTQGALQPTGRELDLGIAGDGYFRVSDGGTPAEVFYTRAGDFYRDNNGDIVNSNGYYLLNTSGNRINIPTDAEGFSIGADGTVTIVGGTDAEEHQISLATFPNPEGLEKVGGNLYRTTDNSGVENPVNGGVPGEGGRGQIAAGTLEMSNVDLSEEFVEMITAQRGLQANTRIITTSDEVLQELLNLK